MKRYRVSIVTAADGSATVFTPRVSGEVHSVHYVKHGSTPFDDGVDFAVTSEATGENIWTEANVDASAVRYPRAPRHSQAGAASLYAAGGTAVQDRVAIANDRVKIVIAQGGNAKLGTVHVLID